MASNQPTSPGTEPFPAEPFPAVPNQDDTTTNRRRGSTSASRAAAASISGRAKGLSKTFKQSEIPKGFFDATGTFASTVVSGEAGARPPATSFSSSLTPTTPLSVPTPVRSATGTSLDGDAKSTTRKNTTVPPVVEEHPQEKHEGWGGVMFHRAYTNEPPAAAPFPNGYHFPPAHSTWQSTKLGAIGLWNYTLTPVGFLVVIYGLNVVAWGGMLFLLLCNASPAMCTPTCNDIDSPRRIWIEIDSQILNALFCVTGFGLAPWRFRDLYFLLRYRWLKETAALRTLAGIHRGWLRLEGSDKLPVHVGPHAMNAEGPAVESSKSESSKSAQVGLSGSDDRESVWLENPAVPLPISKIPDAPLSGTRAPPTALWKLDAVIWLMVWNTFLQCCLCGFMWGQNRHDRPSWSTGLFVALACIVAAIGGIMMGVEGNAVKTIEGVPLSAKDAARLEADREQGLWHWNNIKDKDPAPKEEKMRLKAEKKQAKRANAQAQ